MTAEFKTSLGNESQTQRLPDGSSVWFSSVNITASVDGQNRHIQGKNVVITSSGQTYQILFSEKIGGSGKKLSALAAILGRKDPHIGKRDDADTAPSPMVQAVREMLQRAAYKAIVIDPDKNPDAYAFLDAARKDSFLQVSNFSCSIGIATLLTLKNITLNQRMLSTIADVIYPKSWYLDSTD